MKITFFTPCKGRLDSLMSAFPRNVETILAHQGMEPEFIVLDYSCPQQTGRWAADYFRNVPEVSIYRVADSDHQPYWNYSIANNTAAYLGTASYLFNLIADNLLSEAFLESLTAGLRPGTVFRYHPDSMNFNCFGAIGLPREAFLQLGGYDERMAGWGYDDTQLLLRADLLGLERVYFDDAHVSAIPHSDELRTQFLPGPPRTIPEHMAANAHHMDNLTSWAVNRTGRIKLSLERLK